VILLGCTLLIVLGVPISLLRLFEHSRKDDELALETERSRAEAERQASDASRGYKRAVISGNESVAREHLAKARAAMTRAEKMTDPKERAQALNEAFVGYNMYLQELPDDVEVRIERAGTHQARRNYDLAIADLERAIELRRDLEPALRDRIIQLRLFLARKPQ
jgi:tetratricopeptide (TPR) repeat protein